MSWVKDNPKEWDKITAAAATRSLKTLYQGTDKDDVIQAVVEILQEVFPNVFDRLMEQIPQAMLREAEADYHACRTDHIRDYVLGQEIIRGGNV